MWRVGSELAMMSRIDVRRIRPARQYHVFRRRGSGGVEGTEGEVGWGVKKVVPPRSTSPVAFQHAAEPILSEEVNVASWIRACYDEQNRRTTDQACKAVSRFQEEGVPGGRGYGG